MDLAHALGSVSYSGSHYGLSLHADLAGWPLNVNAEAKVCALWAFLVNINVINVNWLLSVLDEKVGFVRCIGFRLGMKNRKHTFKNVLFEMNE